MIKFTFGEGEDERTFVATGDGRYKDCKISGKWHTPREESVIQVTLNITHITTDKWDTELRGVFDREYGTLKGTMAMPFLRIEGEFVFKRNPESVRFCPSPSTADGPKRLKFAGTSVLELGHKNLPWSPKQITDHVRGRFRLLELTFWEHYRRSLTDAEMEELSDLYSHLDEEDIRLCSLLEMNIVFFE